MQAIAFDLDGAKLAKAYGTKSPNNAYGDIGRFLEKRGYKKQQGSLYFGPNDAVFCVMTVSEMSQEFPWFKESVSDIRMLTIEENNDLKPALKPYHGAPRKERHPSI